MVVVTGKYDGKSIVLDQPMPKDVLPGTPVSITVGKPKGSAALLKIAAMAVDADLPSDFSAQHDHYVKGLPKR